MPSTSSKAWDSLTGPLRTTFPQPKSIVSGPNRLGKSSAASREPPLPALVVLDVAERSTARVSVGVTVTVTVKAEIELLHVVVPEELFGGAIHHDLAGLHDVAGGRDRQRHRRVLLDEQDAG